MSRAYQLEALKRAGITVSELGCIMLDVAMPDLTKVIPDEWGYLSTDPRHWWVAGRMTEGHATLLYGLIPGMVDREAVDEVLEGWEKPVLRAESLEVFNSPFPDEPYACIVARVDHPALMDAHQRLSLLPHINTYPEYKAHITLAYVHRDNVGEPLEELERMMPFEFPPEGLNYGHQIGAKS